MNASALKYLLEVIGIASGVASGVLTGDAKKGVSTMWMTKGLDEGTVFLVRPKPIAPAMNRRRSCKPSFSSVDGGATFSLVNMSV